MGLLGGVIESAMGGGGTTLESFLTKFSSSAGVFVDTIDPLHTFDVTFKFYPTEKDTEQEKDLGKEMLNTLKQAGSQALDNLTMGFASAAGASAGQLKTKHDAMTPDKDSFITKYLA